MSRFTKQAIMDSFMRIAAKKPIGKITVRDIVDDCGVNRNTFYYYFSDVYGLLEEILVRETEKAIARGRETGHPADGCIAIVEWIREHREAFRNIYNTIGRDSVEYAMSKPLDGVMEAHVRRQAEGLAVSEVDIVLIAGVYRNIFFGTLTEWIKKNMRGEPQEYILRIEALFEGAVSGALKNSAVLPPISDGEGK